MSVVFDEVVADVESPATPEPVEATSEQTPKEHGADQLRRDLRRMERREARLRAD